jgi:glycosyltransferase involved in cell wall biosynthesis
MDRKVPHIAFAATSDLSFDQRMQRICRAYCERGHAVQLYGRKLAGSPPLLHQPYGQFRFSCIFQRGKLFYLEFNLRLFVRFLRTRPSAIWAADLDTMAAAALATWLTGAVLLYDAHEYFTETPELQGRPLTRKIWETLASRTIPRANYALTVSESLAEILQARYQRPFLTIRNVPLLKTVNQESVKKAFPPIILYQGVLNAGRGIETAILAMHQLPDLELWVAGEGDLSETLRAQVRQEKLESRVRFLGKLEPEALAQLTPCAFVGINLLDGNSKSYYYSLANKTFDYVQAGVPSIHLNFPEYRRLNAQWECFVLLPELSAQALAGAIRHLLEDPVNYQRLCRNCAEAAKEWNWEKEKKALPIL